MIEYLLLWWLGIELELPIAFRIICATCAGMRLLQFLVEDK